MCIFTQPVETVADTKIFARLESDGWQNLVYQMEFESRELNAMVLPLPVDPSVGEAGLKFVSLEEHPRFFAELERGFPIQLPRQLGPSRGAKNQVDSARPKIRVHEVGDFIASFVPKLADFDRLDERFRIAPEAWDQIPRYEDYGFAVFQLKSLEGTTHPMAFQFRSRFNTGQDDSIFFPTVHIHDGEVHAREDFDHTLYLQSAKFDEACGDYLLRPRLVADSKTGYVRSKSTAGEFCDVDAGQDLLDSDLLVHRLAMRGRLKNEDVFASLDPSRGENSFSRLSLKGQNSAIGLSALAGLSGLAGLTWLFNRRDKLRSSIEQD